MKLNTRYEMLKMDLEIVEHTYKARIGRLYLKDNQLDLEIIRYKNIIQLMKTGLSFGAALKKIEDTFYAEQIRLDHENEEIEMDEEIVAKRKDVSDRIVEDIKTLWKKIIFKFHPDLVSDPAAKAQREEIMKRVNKAYSENDYETLKKIETQHYYEKIGESTVEELEMILVDLENSIIHIRQQYTELKQSDWYNWKIRIEKAKKKNEDIFKDLENDLLDDIVKKINILNNLKKEIGHEGTID